MQTQPKRNRVASKADSNAPEEIASHTEKSRPPRVVGEDRELSQCSETQPGRVGQTVGNEAFSACPPTSTSNLEDCWRSALLIFLGMCRLTHCGRDASAACRAAAIATRWPSPGTCCSRRWRRKELNQR